MVKLRDRETQFGLGRDFFLDPSLYDLELDAIWRRSRLFAGPSCELREAGDFLLLDLDGGDSVVVVRAEDGRLHALHNTCRHRGTRICDEERGHVERWVCPYHQWSYSLDGRLLGCGGMEGEVSLEDYGLHRAAAEEVAGLVFVWLDGGAEPIGPARESIEPRLAPHGLDRARVAHRIDYEVRANWKLVWENNRECWHCNIGHPQYVRANFDGARDDERTRGLAAERAAEHEQALRAAPGHVDHAEPGLFEFPTPGRWWSANRTPLVPGFVTESLDGSPVSLLMGDFESYDIGTLRVRTLPNFWCHASSDHAVLTRVLPAGPERTLVRVQWLVHEEAVEGRDYQLNRLLPFWQLTSEQDWELCERNQAGVRSPAFTPGPRSRRREGNVIAFGEWYLSRLEAAGPPPR
jgi:Rieske 2Fe-2S family protein